MFAIETFKLTKKFSPPRGVMRLVAKSPLKEEITAVDAVNLAVRKGEIFGLIGPNGAGKTTLIKLLCTLLWPTSGSAIVNGYDLVRDEDKVKASVGFVSGQERSFFWRLTGRENLEFFAALNNLLGGSAQRKINEALHQVDLQDAADNMFYSYSSGMKQRLGIARALLTNPAILFFDEPTKSLDAVAAQSLYKLIKEKLVGQERRTVFLTSHRLDEVEQRCDRIAIMHRGKIVYCGTVAQLRDIVKKTERYALEVSDELNEQALFGIASSQDLVDVKISPNVHSNCVKLEFSSSNGEHSLSRCLRDILDSGRTVISCNKEEPSLEELFIERLERIVKN